MDRDATIDRRMEALRSRLRNARRASSAADDDALLRACVELVPRLVDAERCSVFIVDGDRRRILSHAGTGPARNRAPVDHGVFGRSIATGACVVENDPAGLPGSRRGAGWRAGAAARSLLCAPLRGGAGRAVTGVLEIVDKRGGGFDEDDRALASQVADFLSMALESVALNREILRLSEDLAGEARRIRPSSGGGVPPVAESASMRGVLEIARTVAATSAPVLLSGEAGSGKELVARQIHERGPRAGGPFVVVSCAAVPNSLVQGELFGDDGGLFAAPAGARRGLLEQAVGGTLYLDEVGAMRAGMQASLLRALAAGAGDPPDGAAVRPRDVRIVSATQGDLAASVGEGRFRQDLFERLSAVEILVPPLRERREDVVPLALAFLDEFSRRHRKTFPGFSEALLVALEKHAWPGNVRQLRREVERLVALTPPGAALTVEHCSPALRDGAHGPAADVLDLDIPTRVDALERSLIDEALDRTGGNKARAALLLGITRQGLHKKLKRRAGGRNPA